MKSIESFPRIRLGILPTSIHKLENISRLLGRNLYIKRDDMTGLGLGGNKIRKLKFLLAAAAAGKLSMKAVLVLKKRGATCLASKCELFYGSDAKK